MKKILLLGGSHSQLPAIEEAKRRNLYTILCDYLPDNPGRNMVEEYHAVSTTDLEKVLQLAKNRDIDYILAYASDPAALAAAYVSKKMGLCGNSPESVELFSSKHLFRRFQSEHGFHTPWFKVLSNPGEVSGQQLIQFLPVVVKPVDSSDTKGVTLVQNKSQLDAAVKLAFNFSRCGKIIIEEFIDDNIARLHGDGLVMNGKLALCELGDQFSTSKAAPMKPTSTAFPSQLEQHQMQRVVNMVEKVIMKSGLQNGPINIEARINSQNKVYIMEIGARSGGHLTDQCINHYSGFDMLKAHFDAFEGKEVTIQRLKSEPSLFYVLFSDHDGIFRDFRLHDDLKPYIAEYRIYKKPGTRVKSFEKPGSDLGVLVFNFKTPETLQAFKNDLPGKISAGLLVDVVH